VDDEIEPGRTAQTPWRRVSSAVVAVMDELEIVAASWKYDNELDPRCWILCWSHDHDHEKYQACRHWDKPSQNLVWTLASSMKFFQNFKWEPLWVHFNQHLITYCEVMQLFVRLCGKLIVTIADCHLHCTMIMQLMQMGCMAQLWQWVGYLREEGESRVNS